MGRVCVCPMLVRRNTLRYPSQRSPKRNNLKGASKGLESSQTPFALRQGIPREKQRRSPRAKSHRSRRGSLKSQPLNLNA
jgi:hypothetical protein